MIQFGIVVLSYGDPSPATALVEELLDSGVRASQILVVHNPSDTFRVLQIPDVSELQLGTNRGYAAGMNAGIGWWQPRPVDAFLLLTHDARITHECVKAMLAALEAEPELGAVAPTVVDPDDGSIFSCGGRWSKGRLSHHLSPVPVEEIAWLDGCATMLRRSAYENVGPLEERFFLYCEDAEYGLRLRRAGWRLRVLEDHHVTQRSGRDGTRRAAFDYCMQRNSLEVARMYAGWRSAAKLIVRHLRNPPFRASSLGRARMLRADVDFLVRRFGPPPRSFLRATDVSGIAAGKARRFGCAR